MRQPVVAGLDPPTSAEYRLLVSHSPVMIWRCGLVADTQGVNRRRIRESGDERRSRGGD